MPRPYSTDLRERAVEAVESGASRRRIAQGFKVGVSSVIRWCQRWSETGSAAPKRSGEMLRHWKSTRTGSWL